MKRAKLVEAIGVVISMTFSDLSPVLFTDPYVSALLSTFNSFLTSMKKKALEIAAQGVELTKAISELQRFNMTVNDLAEVILSMRRLELELLGYVINPKFLEEEIVLKASNFLQTALDKKWLAEAFLSGPIPQLETFRASDMWELQTIQYIRSMPGRNPFPNIVHYATMSYYRLGDLTHVDFVHNVVEKELVLFKTVAKWLCGLETIHKGLLESFTKALELQKSSAVQLLERARCELELELETLIRKCSSPL